MPRVKVELTTTGQPQVARPPLDNTTLLSCAVTLCHGMRKQHATHAIPIVPKAHGAPVHAASRAHLKLLLCGLWPCLQHIAPGCGSKARKTETNVAQWCGMTDLKTLREDDAVIQQPGLT